MAFGWVRCVLVQCLMVFFDADMCKLAHGKEVLRPMLLRIIGLRSEVRFLLCQKALRFVNRSLAYSGYCKRTSINLRQKECACYLYSDSGMGMYLTFRAFHAACAAPSTIARRRSSMRQPCKKRNTCRRCANSLSVGVAVIVCPVE